jgi:hypothetical protein
MLPEFSSPKGQVDGFLNVLERIGPGSVVLVGAGLLTHVERTLRVGRQYAQHCRKGQKDESQGFHSFFISR